MTTMDNYPSVMEYVIGKVATRRERKHARLAIPRTWFQSLARLMLHVAGFGCLTYAGFTWNMIAGLITAGVSFFVFSWLIAPTDRTPIDPTDRYRR